MYSQQLQGRPIYIYVTQKRIGEDNLKTSVYMSVGLYTFV